MSTRSVAVVLLIIFALVHFSLASQCDQGPHCSSCDSAGACTNCHGGYYLNTIKTCAPCAIGKYRQTSASDKTACSNCAQGYYGDKVAQANQYCSGTCPPGRYGPSSGATGVQDCLLCAAGTYSLGGLSACSACIAGTYGTQEGEYRPKCSGYCAAGTYSSGNVAQLAATAACTPCPVGKYCPFAATAGIDCPAGTYQDVTGNKDPQCKECGPGKYALSGASTCSNCATGGYSPFPRRTTAACAGSLPCPAGTYAPAGIGAITQCKACTAGRYNSVTTGVTACTNCDAGTYSHAAISDKEGAIGATTAACHAPCPAGTWAPAGNALPGHCSPCPQGTYGATTGLTVNTCTGVCPPGSYAPSVAVGLNAVGQISATCIACPVGRYATGSGSSACADCPAGRYGDTERLTVSTCSGLCAAGRYGWGQDISPLCRGPCPAGRWSNAGANGNQCNLCDAGKFGLGGSVDASCTGTCPAGTYSEAGSSTCVNCPAGKYGLGGSTNRDCSGACKAGEYSLAGSVACSPCPVGQSSGSGASTCSACAAGKFTSGGQASDACTGSCLAGYYLRTDGICSLCPAGTFSTAGATQCSACADGTWAPAGSAQCTVCTSPASSGRPACTACAKTTGVCTNCPATSEAAGSAQGCKYCPAGQDSVSGGVCTVCPANRYTFGEGKPCTTCLNSAGPACNACSNANGHCTQCSTGNLVAVAFGGCIALKPTDTTTSVPVLSNQAAVDAAARGPLQQPQVLEQTESRQVVMMPVNVPAGQVDPVELILMIGDSPVRVVVPTDELAGRGVQVVGFSVDLPPLFDSATNKPVSASVTYSVASPSSSIGTQSTGLSTLAASRDLSAAGLRNHKRTLANVATVYLVLTQNATNLACGGARAGATSYVAYALPTYEGRGVYACPVDTSYTVYSLIAIVDETTAAPPPLYITPAPVHESRDPLALGLGIGLGVGIPVVLIALALFYYYCNVCGKNRYDLVAPQAVPVSVPTVPSSVYYAPPTMTTY